MFAHACRNRHHALAAAARARATTLVAQLKRITLQQLSPLRCEWRMHNNFERKDNRGRKRGTQATRPGMRCLAAPLLIPCASTKERVRKHPCSARGSPWAARTCRTRPRPLLHCWRASERHPCSSASPHPAPHTPRKQTSATNTISTAPLFSTMCWQVAHRANKRLADRGQRELACPITTVVSYHHTV